MSTPTNSQPSPGSPSNRAFFADPVLIVAVILGTALRLAYLGHKSLWLDEAATFSLCRLPLQAFVHAWWGHEANMTAYYALQRVWLHLGSSEWMLRFPSALFGIASIPVIYSLGRRIFDTNTARIAALLLAVNPTHLEYSQEARSYAMTVFLVLLASLLLVRAIETGDNRMWTGYVLVGALSVYAHFFAALVLAAHCLSLLALHPRSIQLRKILWAAAALAILCLPGIAFVFFRGETMDLYWLAPVGWLSLVKLAQFYTGSGVKFFLALLLTIAGVWSLRPRIADADQPHRWYAVLLLNWIGLPIALAFLASLHRNVFSYKYLLICLPPVLLLVAKGATVMRREIRWVLVAIILVASIATDISFYRKPREDWRALNQYIASSFQEGDGITFYPPYTRNPFDYYHSRTGPDQLQILAPEVIAGDLTQDVFDEAHPAAMVAGAKAKRFWLVVYGTDKTPPEVAARTQSLIDALPPRYTLRLSKDFHNVRLQMYALTSP